MSETGASHASDCPHCQASQQAASRRADQESSDDPHRDLDLAAEAPDQYDLGPSARYPQYFNAPRKPASDEQDDDDFDGIVEIDEATGEALAPVKSAAPGGPPPLPPKQRQQGSDAFNMVVGDDQGEEYELDLRDSHVSPTAPATTPTPDLVNAAPEAVAEHGDYHIDLEHHQPEVVAPHAEEVAKVATAASDSPDDEPSKEETTPQEPVAAVEEDPVYIPVVCRNCKTRMYALLAQVGQSIKCPDCYAQNVVPSPEVRKTRPKAEEPAGDDHYQLSAPVERPTLEAMGYLEIFEKERSRPVAAKGESRRQDVESYAAPKLPKAPFTVGVFDYPVYPEMRVPWVGLTGGLLPVLVTAKFSYELFIEGEGAAIGGLLLGGIALLLGAVWAAAAASCFLAIVQSTSEGLDDLGAAAESDWSDKAFSAFYFVSALLFSVVPGYLPMQLFGAGPLVTSLIALTTGWFLFPLALLSMLETNSPFVPYSRPVWRSLSLGQGAWKTFYFMTALVALAGYFAVVAAIPTGTVAMIIAVAIVVGAAMIYFRLLGRLALVCAEFMSIDPDDEEPPVEDDDE